MKHKTIVLLGVFFICFNLSISCLAPRFVDYAGFFPYKQELEETNLPASLESYANFDGILYYKIAKKGYEESTQALFPLYPLLMNLLPFNPLVNGLLISYVSFILLLSLLNNYLDNFLDNHEKRWFFLLFLTFPTSFYLQAVYTESLFLLLFILTMYLTQKENYKLAIIPAFLAGLTRLMGLFVAVALFFITIWERRYQIFSQWGRSFRGVTPQKKSDTKFIPYITMVLSPIFGFLLYALYLWQTTGDPLIFFHAQPDFGANRSTELIILPQVVYRYIKIFLTAQPNYQYFIALMEFCIFMLVFGFLLLDLWKIIKKKYKNAIYSQLGLNIFSLINIVLPTLTGTFSSIPRYALVSISFFMVVSSLENRWIKIVIASVFFILHIAFLIFFTQGYFVS